MRSFEVATGEIAIVMTREELEAFRSAIQEDVLTEHHTITHAFILGQAQGTFMRALAGDHDGESTPPISPLSVNWGDV